MNRRDFLIAGGAAVAGGLQVTAAEAAAPVVLGAVSLSFYRVTGAVVTAVLERLGHSVQLIEGTHEEIFPLVGESRLDLLAAAWLPEGHASYWARYGADAVEVATLYDGARFYWGVPDHVPEADVASVADLAKPKVAQRMAQEIQGIGQGATISVMSQQAIGAYGLEGYSFRAGTQAEWLSAYRAALAQKRWIVVPMWTPLFLNHGGGLRPLRDPLGTFGGLNRAVLVGPRARVDALPERTRRALARMTLDIPSVTQMDWDVNVRSMSARDAALAWMAANEDRVKSWFCDSAEVCN